MGKGGEVVRAVRRVAMQSPDERVSLESLTEPGERRCCPDLGLEREHVTLSERSSTPSAVWKCVALWAVVYRRL